MKTFETFVIRETTDRNSYRRGDVVRAKNLTAAKIAASHRQLFEGTVLSIETTAGRRLAYKENGVWHVLGDK